MTTQKKQRNKPKVPARTKLSLKENQRINREVMEEARKHFELDIAQNYFVGVSHVVAVSTDCGGSCVHCFIPIGLERFAESINHYIQEHDYKLLHVGTVTSIDRDGKPYHSSLALLGID